MKEIDEIKIDGNVLTIFDTKGERHRFKMGVPEQVYEEVAAKLGYLVTATGVTFHQEISSDGVAIERAEVKR